MLFNGYSFLLLFLPAAVAVCALIDRLAPLRTWTLILFSLAFYGSWDVRLVPLLVGSVLFNWLAAWAFERTRNPVFTTGAIVADLAALGFFKYTNFLIDNVAAVTGWPIGRLQIVLPLGISFFTFHHIMYLVDLRRGRIGLAPFDRYALYICFFPQLIAGPLARGRQVLHQFGREIFRPGWERRCSIGITFIVVGLIEKVFLGDGLANLVGPAFTAARAGPVTDGSAWLALGFGFQIFFDFSGYSDIAIGVALIFGIELPQNFNAPFQAEGIQDFWRRWHITLALFLRDYVFLPLCDLRIGGRRHIIAALVTTMALCGLWHGAGWTFVLWGTLHGLALALATIWPKSGVRIPAVVGRAATVAFVLATAILFGTESLQAAANLLAGLAHLPNSGQLAHAWLIGLAAACAFLLPSSQALCIQLAERPYPATAAALALGAMAVLVQLGAHESYEFVYFQF